MGRPRKKGVRTKSGRLSRVLIVKGNDRAEVMKELYGGNGSDAIGRAYERGLLGEGNDAKAMLDTARAISRAYWAAYTNGPIRCTLADRQSGASAEPDEERERRQETWLLRMLKTAGQGGNTPRLLFDQLVVDINPDCGPLWLDRILAKETSPNDWASLACALDTLADCAGVQRLTQRMRA
jgi:hypothetical protein